MSNQSDYEYGEYGDYNDSDLDYGLVGPCSQQSASRLQLVVGPYLHSLICMLGLVGNGLVIATYAFYKRRRSMTDVYLLNVAVADLLFVAALPLLAYNERWAWPMGPLACRLLRGCYSVNLFSGTLLLACVSADRYVAIVQPRRSFRLRSPRRGRLVCGAVWAAALLLSAPTVYFSSRYEPAHTRDAFLDPEGNQENRSSGPPPPRYVCEFRFADNATAWRAKLALPGTQLAAGFFLPLLVMALCYGAVAAALLRARTFQRHKAVRVVLAVVAVFVACHLPYNATLLIDTAAMFRLRSCEEADALQAAKTLTQTLAYLHCCLNPLLYAFVGVRFRAHFRRAVLDLCCLGGRSLGPRRCSRVTSEVTVSARRSLDGASEHASSFTM